MWFGTQPWIWINFLSQLLHWSPWWRSSSLRSWTFLHAQLATPVCNLLHLRVVEFLEISRWIIHLVNIHSAATRHHCWWCVTDVLENKPPCVLCCYNKRISQSSSLENGTWVCGNSLNHFMRNSSPQKRSFLLPCIIFQCTMMWKITHEHCQCCK